MTGRDGTDKGGGEDKDLSNYISPHSYCFIEEVFLGIEKKYPSMGRSKEIKMKMRCQRVLSINMQWVYGNFKGNEEVTFPSHHTGH